MDQRLAAIDRRVHEPARLAILTVLASCLVADFSDLQRATGLTKGNLSVQLMRLEAAGLIEIEKRIQWKKTRTTAGLTEAGRVALGEYWGVMDRIRGWEVG